MWAAWEILVYAYSTTDVLLVEMLTMAFILINLESPYERQVIAFRVNGYAVWLMSLIAHCHNGKGLFTDMSNCHI